MLALYQDFVDKLSRAEEDDEEIEPSVVRPRKVPEAVRQTRERGLKLEIHVTDSDLAYSSSRFEALYASNAHVKRARVKSGLSIYYQFRPSHFVEDPLQFWVKKSKDPSCPFPTRDIFSIPAMSAEC